jgi:hypothetical protein
MAMSRVSILTAALAALMAVAAPGVAAARDRDKDGLPDRWEKRHHLSVHQKSANADPDRDRVDNRNEYRERTNPRDKDSDNDGRRDGGEDRDRDTLSNAAEDATGNDPADRDTDDDGVPDGKEQAGVVGSFVDDELTIRLSSGGSVTGDVTEDTELECVSEAQAERKQAHDSRRGRRGHASVDPDDELGDDEGFDDGDNSDGWEYGDDEGFEDDDGDFGDDAEWDDEDGDWDEEDGDEEDAKGLRGVSCPLSRLKAGAAVHEAEIEIGPDGTFFVAIELLG